MSGDERSAEQDAADRRALTAMNLRAAITDEHRAELARIVNESIEMIATRRVSGRSSGPIYLDDLMVLITLSSCFLDEDALREPPEVSPLRPDDPTDLRVPSVERVVDFGGDSDPSTPPANPDSHEWLGMNR